MYLFDHLGSSQLPNISGVASVARSESEDRAFKSSPIAILSPGKKMPGHSDPKAMGMHSSMCYSLFVYLAALPACLRIIRVPEHAHVVAVAGVISIFF